MPSALTGTKIKKIDSRQKVTSLMECILNGETDNKQTEK